MTDLYRDFAALAAHECEGVDFRVVARRRGSAVAIVAPHGGGIEPGTSEISGAIAGASLSLYAFEGLKRRGNHALHITSTRFDEPRGIALVAAADRVVTIHGEGSDEPVVFVGGLDLELCTRMRNALGTERFEVRPLPGLEGAEPSNLCNRGRSNAGAQLEIARGLRASFFVSLRAAGRRMPTSELARFVAAARWAVG